MLIILIAAAVALVVVSIFAFALAGTSAYSPSGSNGNYPNGMMSGWGWMGSMMGGYGGSAPQSSTGASSAVLPIMGFAALIGAALMGVGGAAYYFGVPRIGLNEQIANSTAILPQNPVANEVSPFISVSKTLTAEERKVLDVLASHDGKYLQKYICKETGLSRLKVHRIVTRLAERGVLTYEKSGNTNEVRLSKWLEANQLTITKEFQKDKIRIEVEA